MKNRRFFLSLVLLSLSIQAAVETPPDFRLVVTGNLAGLHDGSQSFYDLPIFRLGSTNSDFVITHAKRNVLRADNVVFLSSSTITPAEVIAASKGVVGKSGRVTILRGIRAFSFAFNDTIEPNRSVNDFMTRNLGAVQISVPYELRKVGDKEILALSLAENLSIKWPSLENSVVTITAAEGKFSSKKENHVFIAREHGATARALGIVDKELKSSISTGYVDVGNSLMGDDDNVDEAPLMHNILIKRNPLALGVGRSESIVKERNVGLLSSAPYVLEQPVGKNIGKNKIHFVSIGKNIPQIDMADADLLFALAPSLEDARNVVADPVFDAVFAISQSRGILPPVDDMTLSKQARSAPPLLRVSSSDVTLAEFWLEKNSDRQVARIRITRIPIDFMAPVAQDVEETLSKIVRPQLTSALMPIALVNKNEQAWTQLSFDNVFGGMLIEAAKAELALFEQQDDTITPIHGEVPHEVFYALAKRKGRMVSFKAKGEYLSTALKFIAKNKLSTPIAVSGASPAKGTISGRRVNATEWYRVVATETAFVAFNEFLVREGFTSKAPVRSELIAAYVGETHGLHVLRNVKVVSKADEAKAKEEKKLSESIVSVPAVVRQALNEQIGTPKLQSYFAEAKGKMRPTIAFHIENLDLGFNMNLLNSVAAQWQDDTKDPKKPDYKIPDSRLILGQFIHVLANAKMSLNFTSHEIDLSLIGSLKFFHAGVYDEPSKAKGPNKDKISTSLEMRLPVERWVPGYDKSFYVTPFMSFTYDTKLFPVSFLTRVPSDEWEKNGFDRPHTGLYFLGLIGQPFLNGDVRLGGVLFFNFVDEIEQAVDYGAQFASRIGGEFGPIGLELNSSLMVLLPTAENPRDDKLGLISQFEGRVIVARFGDFSISLLGDIYFGTTMVDRTSVGVSYIAGVAASYGQRFKWLL